MEDTPQLKDKNPLEDTFWLEDTSQLLEGITRLEDTTNKCLTLFMRKYVNIKANIYAISSDIHQLQLIKLHYFKRERLKLIQ